MDSLDPTNWTPGHEHLACSVGRDLFIPGADRQDAIQEARIGIHQAMSRWDRTGPVPFAAFAALVARRRILDAITSARRAKHRMLNDADCLEPVAALDDGGEGEATVDLPTRWDDDPAQIVITREATRELLTAIGDLTPRERDAVERVLINGDTYKSAGDSKSVDNALQRARRKLQQFMEGQTPQTGGTS